jgi:hypothetical protein
LAIKGKGKTRGGRPGTNAPRPVVVVPKKPFLARRSTRWGVMALIVAIVGATLFIAWQKQRDTERRDAQGQAIDDVDSRIEAILQPVGQPGQGTGIILLPQFTAAVQEFRAGEGKKPAPLVKLSKPLPRQLDGVIEGVDAIELPDELRPDYTNDVIDAKAFVIEAVRSYRVAVRLALAAVQVDSATARNAILDQIEDLVLNGAQLLERGTARITRIQREVGTLDPSEFNPVPSIPGG